MEIVALYLPWGLKFWYILCCAAFVACAYIDLRTRKIPNRITYPCLAISLMLTLVAQQWPAAIWGGLLAGAIFLAPRLLLGRKKAGMGDVKLAVLGGLLLGPESTLSALVITFVSAVIILTPLVWIGRIERKQAIPFGPYIALGFIVLLFPLIFS